MKKQGLSFYILILLLAAALVGLVVFLPRSGPDTPPVLLPSPTPAPDVNAGPSDAAAGDDLIAVDPTTVQAAVATLRRADSYSRTLSVRDLWSGGSRERHIDVWARGDELRLQLRVGDSEVTQHLLLRGGETWLWYSDSQSVWQGTARDGDGDAYQTILTYEDMLALPAEDILDAGYTVFGGEQCIYVCCRSGSLGYRSEFYIHLATGLLLGERCYDGETLIYSMESTVPDLSTPDESIFAVPSQQQHSADGE